MKNFKTPFFLLLLTFISFSAFAGNKATETTIWVDGVCDMCKERIELAVDVKGVKFAEYDLKTKELKIVFNEKKISLKEIHELIAKAGHDTKEVKATDEAYANVHGCCKYREGGGACSGHDHDDHDHEEGEDHDHEEH